MTANEFLAHLDLVRQCGDKRWVARCPAHLDEHPSLAVAQGEHAILVRCWGGCTFTEIVKAVGLTAQALFSGPKQPGRRKPRKRNLRTLNSRDLRDLAFQLKSYADEIWLNSETVLSAARGLHPSEWTPEEMDLAVEMVADAYANRHQATVLDERAVELWLGHSTKEKRHAS